MPSKRDPFKDQRFTSNGVPPKQATKQKEQKRMRTRRKVDKATKDLRAAQKELNATDKVLEQKKMLLSMMQEAPTIAAQRKILFSMFTDAGFNPVQELIEHANDESLPLKDRIALKKTLMEYYQPKPKSVDIQASVTGEMTIQVISFDAVTKTALKEADVVELAPDDEYDEFLSPEEKELAGRDKTDG